MYITYASIIPSGLKNNDRALRGSISSIIARRWKSSRGEQSNKKNELLRVVEQHLMMMMPLYLYVHLSTGNSRHVTIMGSGKLRLAVYKAKPATRLCRTLTKTQFFIPSPNFFPILVPF